MRNEEIVQLMQDLKFDSFEVEQWQQVLPDLEVEDKEELSAMLLELKSERNILAAKQCQEVADLIKSWQK